MTNALRLSTHLGAGWIPTAGFHIARIFQMFIFDVNAPGEDVDEFHFMQHAVLPGGRNVRQHHLLNATLDIILAA